VPCERPVPSWVRTSTDGRQVLVYDLLVWRSAERFKLCAVEPFHGAARPGAIAQFLDNVPDSVSIIIWFNFVFSLREACTTEDEYHTAFQGLERQAARIWPPPTIGNYWANKARYVADLQHGNAPIAMLPTIPLPCNLSGEEKAAALQEQMKTWTNGTVFKRNFSGRSAHVQVATTDQSIRTIEKWMLEGGGLLQEYEERVTHWWEYRVYVLMRTAVPQILWIIRSRWNESGTVIHAETVTATKVRRAVEAAAVKIARWLCQQPSRSTSPILHRFDFFWTGEVALLNEIEYLGDLAFLLMTEDAQEELVKHLLLGLEKASPTLCAQPSPAVSLLLCAGPRRMGIRNPKSWLCHMIAAVQLFLRVLVPWSTLFNPAVEEERDSKSIIEHLKDVATASSAHTPTITRSPSISP